MRPSSTPPGVLFGLLSRLEACMGGRDPAAGFTSNYAPAADRPLQKIAPGKEAIRCPADKGGDLTDGELAHRPSDWDAIGCSYRFKGSMWLEPSQLRGVPADPRNNLCQTKESWVPEPARFITAHRCRGSLVHAV